MGTWPVKEFPVQLTETPAYMGGPIDRASPSYAEDNRYIYPEVLGLMESEVAAMQAEDVI